MCNGIITDRSVSHDSFYHDSYIKLNDLPGGGVRLMVSGKYNEDAEEGTDLRAVVEKYVSVSIVNNVG